MTEEETSYYRHLAETVLRAWDHPTSPPDKVYKFLDFGLVYGPSETWPALLTEAWAIGGMPSPTEDREWPCEENMEVLVACCRGYLEQTT